MIKCPNCKKDTISMKWYLLWSFKKTTCSSCGAEIRMEVLKGFALSGIALLGFPLFWNRIFVDDDYLIPSVFFFGWLLLSLIIMIKYPFLKIVSKRD